MTASRRIALGVSGSIAAVKAPEIVRRLVDAGYEVQCVLSAGGEHFVSPLALATFSGRPVVSRMWAEDAYKMPHLHVAAECDAFLIAPASASIIARCAHGLADDMVSLIYVTTTKPVLIAPAMHPTMWEHAATRENVRVLKERGVQFVGPYVGPLADQRHGEGRMSEPEELVAAVGQLLSEKRAR